MSLKVKTLIFLCFCIPGFTMAQLDSLVLLNDNVIVGEIKSMDKGVLSIETDYSDQDFKIEWSGIKAIFTETYFFITLSDGSLYNGEFRSTGDGDQIEINIGSTENPIVHLPEIVYLKSVDSGFWSKLYASIDLGVSLTKANNLQQFNARSSLGYLGERWKLDFKYDMLTSTQDNAKDVNRIDSDVRVKIYLQNDWYTIGEIDFLSNTEQLLDLRTNFKAGMGKFVIHTNHTYWGFQGGLSFNNEVFTESPERQSIEGFFGSELNMFDIGDFSMLAMINAYPSFTEAQRWRTDIKLDIKYDLPLDFYIKLGYSLNFDNQPAENAAKSDYVIQTNFGWEL